MRTARLETYAINTSPTRRLRQGTDYLMAPATGVAAVALFEPDSYATRTHDAEEQAAALAIDALAANCVERASAVSVRVLAHERTRQDAYTVDRLVGSLRLAHERVREAFAAPRFVGSIVALHASPAGLTVASVEGGAVLYRVRAGAIERLAGHEGPAAFEPRTPATWLGGAAELAVQLRDERLEHGDVFVLSPGAALGAQLAGRFVDPRVDFGRALANSLASGPTLFHGLVARWAAP